MTTNENATPANTPANRRRAARSGSPSPLVQQARTCAHTRDYRTHLEDGTQICACGATFATDGTVIRPTVVIGWDGASRPIIRYQDELGLPDYMRSTP